MNETQQTDQQGTTTPAPEEENVYLFYEDVETNPGPGEFVMHGVNLYFIRGKVTGPVTATIAGIVTGRKKKPAIRIATDAEKGAAAKPAATQETEVAKTDDTTKTGESTKAGDDASITTNTTGPGDPDPNAKPQTERRPQPGTTLTAG